jgi:hypothetical protein
MVCCSLLSDTTYSSIGFRGPQAVSPCVRLFRILGVCPAHILSPGLPTLGILVTEIINYSISNLVFIGRITKQWYSLQHRANRNRFTSLLGQREGFLSLIYDPRYSKSPLVWYIVSSICNDGPISGDQMVFY